MLPILLFTDCLGPLTREDTNIVLGVLYGSGTNDDGQVMRYTDVRDAVIQNWIQGIVPDVEILGRLF